MEKKSCDVAVIGAGIGGLCVAARLSYAGYKTILLEKMPIVGGRYTWVHYKGYQIPLGAVFVYYGERDPVIATLRDVHGDTGFEMKPWPMPKWRIDGKDYEAPTPGTFWRLISLALRDKQEEERVIKAFRRCFKWREPSDYISFSEWLLRLTDNKTLHNILEAWFIQVIGPSLHDISAGETFRYFVDFMGSQQMSLPKNGLKPIVDSLVKVITGNKGQIMTRVKVQKILVRDGVAEGVEVSGLQGQFEIQAGAVVSNVGPQKTVQLAGEQNFDPGYPREVKERIRPFPGAFVFYLTSDGPLYDWPGGLYTIDTRRKLLWLDMGLVWPELAPKGKNLTWVYVKPRHPTLYDPREEYEIFLADLAETFPRFKEQGGEIMLAHHYHSEWPLSHAFPTNQRHQKTPIENLYNVGDAVNPPGLLAGSGVAEGARMVAEDIKRRIKL